MDERVRQEWLSQSNEWRSGWKVYQNGNTIQMSHEEISKKSDEWKAGARYAAEHPFGITAYPQ